jgi:hypothetical protein
MLARLALVASLVLGGCSGKSDAPAAGGGDKLGFPLVSDAIANQLADANVIVALDVDKLGLKRFGAMVPDMLGCVKELITKVDTAVIGATEETAEGFVTGLPEDTTKKCIGTLAPMLGVKTEDKAGVFELDLAGDKFDMVWKDGTVSIKDVAHPMKAGAPSDRMRKLVAQVPKDAEGWIVSGGFPKYKITQAVVWLKSSDKAWHLVVTADSAEAGVAKDWLQGIVTGFTQAATQKGVTVDPKWFTITETGTAAKLEADIPLSLFDRPAEAQ